MRKYFYKNDGVWLDLICNRCRRIEHLDRLTKSAYVCGRLVPDAFKTPSCRFVNVGPGKDLCEPCYEKYKLAGEPADFFEKGYK